MSKIIIDDQLYQLKLQVNKLLEDSAEHEYLDTCDCLDVLNFAVKALENVAQQPDLPLEEP